ncbi:MAG: ABC transporter ATP-binding protein [Actinobacteria bacterium]|nr:ABC transporter ATP-binding protein [Actinomycetota bacterium]
MNLLDVSNVTKKFGGVVANEDVSLRIDRGEIVGLIGPNGAGKTTLFKCIAGFHKVDRGTIKFEGHDVTGLPPESICLRGIARTFQIVRVFREMTVLENVLIGALSRMASVRTAKEKALKILDLTGLAGKKDQLGRALTIADKKRLEMARALATVPKLLLLDEVMAGLTPAEIKEAVRLVREVQRSGVTILMVEHVMEAIMPLADRLVVLHNGRKICEGPPGLAAQDERVIKAYLGGKYRAPG